MIPRKIGDWSVVDTLGSGGQGLVLRAKKTKLNGEQLEAAIKVPISDFSKVTTEVRNQSIQFLIHEFEMLELVNSPNVCRVIDSGIEVVKVGQKTTELPWLATELIKGDDLMTEIKNNGPLDETSWAQLAWDIAMGIAAIHKVGATHLDLKPQNVVRHARRAIVIDLGGASFVGKLDLGDLIQAKTIPFAAPEQLDQRHDPEDYEYPVDIYALGATLYYAAKAVTLFDAEGALTKQAYAKDRYRLMKTESFDRSGLSSQQAELIFDLCRFKPSDRISIEVFLTRLVQLLPEKDARRSAQISSQLPLGEISNNDAPVAQKSPETPSQHSKPRIDGKGWLATILLCFLPPLVGPFLRFFQLGDTKPNTSERTQLRFLLALGSLLSFGTLGAFAFIRKYRSDQKPATRILAIGFAVLSVSLLLSTVIGINSEPESEPYVLMQFVTTLGLFANIFVISPVSAALGVFDRTVKEIGTEGAEEPPM